jgi:hypothetical protein
VYQIIIEATGGDDRVKANILPMALTDAARSWLINLLEGSITLWDQRTYEHPSTVETLKTIKQKHDESLRDYVKRFCHARNAISYIQDIKTINAFYDGVRDVKIVEEITMKKLKTMIDLLAVTDVCIEASEAHARLLESWARGPQGRRMTTRLTKLTEAIARTEGTVDTMTCSPQIRRRRDPFGILMT